MSHCMGVMCERCKEVLVSDADCPERGCPGNHGYTYQGPGPWAAKTWPNHPCLQEK